jgi:hypothetical protein
VVQALYGHLQSEIAGFCHSQIGYLESHESQWLIEWEQLTIVVFCCMPR